MPKKLSRLFERYIEKYESLGFKTVSQYANHILQEEGLRIVKNNPELANSEKE